MAYATASDLEKFKQWAENFGANRSPQESPLQRYADFAISLGMPNYKDTTTPHYKRRKDEFDRIFREQITREAELQYHKPTYAPGTEPVGLYFNRPRSQPIRYVVPVRVPSHPLPFHVPSRLQALNQHSTSQYMENQRRLAAMWNRPFGR